MTVPKAAKAAKTSEELGNSGASEYKERLILAALEIIEEDGFHAVTAGKLAAKVNLSRTVVHYHFGKIDDLLAEAIEWSYREIAKELVERFKHENPADVIWQHFGRGHAPADELRVMAMRSETIRNAQNRAFTELSAILVANIEAAYRRLGAVPEIPVEVMVLIMMMGAQYLGTETALGASPHHQAAKDYIHSLFRISAPTGADS